jgi:large subunit ribosomal protein L18
MLKQFDRKGAVARRHRRVRRKVSGSGERPRLAVYRSQRHLYVQLIDDAAGRTMASASTLQLKASKNDTQTAAEVGQMIAEKAKQAGITQAVFDRGGFLYHGRVKALADAARAAGVKF